MRQPSQRLPQTGAGHRVALADVDGGREAAGLGTAGERAYPPAASEQLGQEMGADVAGRAGQQDGIGFM